MTIKVVCTGCSRELDVPESFAGKQGKCPYCMTVLNIPDLEAECNSMERQAEMPSKPQETEKAKPFIRANSLNIRAFLTIPTILLALGLASFATALVMFGLTVRAGFRFPAVSYNEPAGYMIERAERPAPWVIPRSYLIASGKWWYIPSLSRYYLPALGALFLFGSFLVRRMHRRTGQHTWPAPAVRGNKTAVAAVIAFALLVMAVAITMLAHAQSDHARADEIVCGQRLKSIQRMVWACALHASNAMTEPSFTQCTNEHVDYGQTDEAIYLSFYCRSDGRGIMDLRTILPMSGLVDKTGFGCPADRGAGPDYGYVYGPHWLQGWEDIGKGLPEGMLLVAETGPYHQGKRHVILTAGTGHYEVRLVGDAEFQKLLNASLISVAQLRMPFFDVRGRTLKEKEDHRAMMMVFSQTTLLFKVSPDKFEEVMRGR